MYPDHPDMDYRLFQNRHRDYEREADIERLIKLCRQHERPSAFSRIMAPLSNAGRALYQALVKQYPETTSIKTESVS